MKEGSITKQARLANTYLISQFQKLETKMAACRGVSGLDLADNMSIFSLCLAQMSTYVQVSFSHKDTRHKVLETILMASLYPL